MPKKPSIKQNSRNVITLRFDEISAGWEYWLLMVSDAHHDSTHCNRKLERRHLEMAKARDGLIFHAGDTFDAMQGKFDPKRSLSDVRPEDACKDYYNKIVDHAVEDYADFADHFVLFGKGNHETAVLDKTSQCLISSLVKDLNKHVTDPNHCIYTGGYGGWIRLMFTANKTNRSSMRVKYHHGSGGPAPVTRGAIQTNRQAVFLPDADVVWNGHNHQGYIMPIARERLTTNGKVKRDLCWFIRTPGYQDAYDDGYEGYVVEKNAGTTPNGAVWLRLYYENDLVKVKPIPEME